MQTGPDSCSSNQPREAKISGPDPDEKGKNRRTEFVPIVMNSAFLPNLDQSYNSLDSTFTNNRKVWEDENMKKQVNSREIREFISLARWMSSFVFSLCSKVLRVPLSFLFKERKCLKLTLKNCYWTIVVLNFKNV
jgi:hypothetical protein